MIVFISLLVLCLFYLIIRFISINILKKDTNLFSKKTVFSILSLFFVGALGCAVIEAVFSENLDLLLITVMGLAVAVLPVFDWQKSIQNALMFSFCLMGSFFAVAEESFYLPTMIPLLISACIWFVFILLLRQFNKIPLLTPLITYPIGFAVLIINLLGGVLFLPVVLLVIFLIVSQAAYYSSLQKTVLLKEGFAGLILPPIVIDFIAYLFGFLLLSIGFGHYFIPSLILISYMGFEFIYAGYWILRTNRPFYQLPRFFFISKFLNAITNNIPVFKNSYKTVLFIEFFIALLAVACYEKLISLSMACVFLAFFFFYAYRQLSSINEKKITVRSLFGDLKNGYKELFIQVKSQFTQTKQHFSRGNSPVGEENPLRGEQSISQKNISQKKKNVVKNLVVKKSVKKTSEKKQPKVLKKTTRDPKSSLRKNGK